MRPPKSPENWRKQVQFSLPDQVLAALDELAKLDVDLMQQQYGRAYVDSRPNRSGTIQRLIRAEYRERTGKKLPH
jgi:hypothetical protein